MDPLNDFTSVKLITEHKFRKMKCKWSLLKTYIYKYNLLAPSPTFIIRLLDYSNILCEALGIITISKFGKTLVYKNKIHWFCTK